MLFLSLMMLSVNKNTFLALLIIIPWSIQAWSSNQKSDLVQLKTQGDTLSFELSGQNDWNYDLKRIEEKNQTKVLLTVKGLDNQNYDKIVNIKNPFIAAIKVLPNAVDGKKRIEFTLNNSKVETFDYLTDYPSKLIVDFYYKEAFKAKIENEKESDVESKVALTKIKKQKKEVAQKPGLKNSSKEVSLNNHNVKEEETEEDRLYFKNFKNDEFEIQENLKKDVVKNPSRKDNRNPAGVDYFQVSDFNNDEAQTGSQIDLKAGLFNISDDQLTRFKIKAHEINPENIQKSLSEYYINYPLLDREFSFWTKIKVNLPEYQIKSENNDENKQIRLIQKLFNKKRSLVLRQTTDWFANKYPKSKYLEVAYGMTADSLMQLWETENKVQDFDLAQVYYSKIIDQFPQSALNERTSLAAGFYEIDRKNYLSGMRKLKAHSENPQYQNKNSKFYADLGISYCLSKLNKLDDAIKMTEDIEQQSNDRLIKAEASYRKGDYLMLSEKYVETKNQYEASQKKYPELSNEFPNGVFNKMEALFNLKMNIESHAAALDFISQFPYHDYAPYALTRLGELLEIVGAPQERAVGTFLETHFRYGDSPKTIIARLHLLSTRMKGMKELELKNTIQKMNELAKKSDLENIDQFKTTMISDGYIRRKEFDNAIKTLVQYYQESPSKKNSEQVTNRIKNSIHNYIQYLSDNNQNKDVLKIYKHYADNWIRKQERADTFYYLGKAYQAAGAYSEALKKYNLAEEKIYSNRSVASVSSMNSPKIEQIYLTQAQSLFEQNDFKNSETILDKIKNPDVLSVSDQIARVNLASELYEHRGDNETAIRYLSEIVRVWKSKPDLVSDSAIRVAKLLNKIEQPQRAINMLDSLLNEKLSAENTRKIYKAKGDIATEAKLSDIAINSLSYILNPQISLTLTSEGEDLSKTKYQLGELYFQKGELKKAENTWTSFSEKDDQFWSKLASEKMKSAKWQDEYKKYLKRIPAAVGVQ